MDRIKAGYVEGIVSIVVNTLLFVVKMWAGIVTGSLALAADAWHTLSDSVSSVAVIIGARLASMSASEKHPFGHGRWEQITSIFIALILGLVAYDFLKSSIIQFNNRASVEYGLVAIVVTIASIIVKEVLAQYAFRLGKETGNSSVTADGWHHRSDALSSIVVLVGIMFAGKLWWIDSVLGAIIALMLFYVAFEITKDAITVLLGQEPSRELIEDITTEIKKGYGDDLAPHHFHLHDYTTHKELTFHIKLSRHLTIKDGHDVATKIEDMVKNKFGIEATIHLEAM